jgi:hypothetical protein
MRELAKIILIKLLKHSTSSRTYGRITRKETCSEHQAGEDPLLFFSFINVSYKMAHCIKDESGLFLF